MGKLPDEEHHEAIEAGAGDTAALTIDLSALAENYSLLDKESGRAECAAVVKADAYGLGVQKVAEKLAGEGCKTFFVANLSEAVTLRKYVKYATIYNMGGLFSGTGQHYIDHDIRPVLNTPGEIQEWSQVGRYPTAIQVNTGMNRLGIQLDYLKSIVSDPHFKNLNITLLMSHLACADEPDHPLNAQQLERFQLARTMVPDIPASLCNSAGIFLGPDYHFDIVRPGISLYGGRARTDGPNPMKNVAFLDGRIAQITDVPTNASVGYGAAHTLTRPSRIATISLGYADGFFRALGSTDLKQKANVYIGGHFAPLVGRVSMDLITVDITDIPENLIQRGDMVEIIGSHITVDDLANQADTIGYEILTSLGRRYRRIYR